MKPPRTRSATTLCAFTLISLLGASQSGAESPTTPIAPMPERLVGGLDTDAHRSGDLQSTAIATLDALEAAGNRPLTVRDIRALGIGPQGVALALEQPESIRIWRRGVDGSSESCQGRVDVIAFEDYVRGVLPFEWYASWDVEALKAGAIAIRTYAAAWVQNGGKYDCADLDDTTASQVYHDPDFAQENLAQMYLDKAYAAIEATSHVYVVKEDSLVFAEYSAENSDPTAFGVDEPHCTGLALKGHGRGTCQWGTQRWALDGKTFDWIVPHYYPDSELVNLSPGGSLVEEAYRETMFSGDRETASLSVYNATGGDWEAGHFAVVATSSSAFYEAESWPSEEKAVASSPAIAAGETATISWTMLAPDVEEPTEFSEQFELVLADNSAPNFPATSAPWSIEVWPAEERPGETDVDEDKGLVGGCGCNGSGSQGGSLVLLAGLAFFLLSRRRWV